MSEQIFTIVVGGAIFNSFIHSSVISSVYKRPHFVICFNLITYVTQHVKSQEENEEERAALSNISKICFLNFTFCKYLSEFCLKM